MKTRDASVRVPTPKASQQQDESPKQEETSPKRRIIPNSAQKGSAQRPNRSGSASKHCASGSPKYPSRNRASSVPPGSGRKGSPKDRGSSKGLPSVSPMTDDDSSDDGGFTKPAPRHRQARKGSDADLVKDVRLFMKTNKLSQVTVGQEARISQAVMSQWLSLKYHGHNDKVDSAMRQWLLQRKMGRTVMPRSDEPTSVLRPSRATTVGEKAEKKRKQQAEGHKKIKKEIMELQQEAASEGLTFKELDKDDSDVRADKKLKPAPSLESAISDAGRATPARLLPKSHFPSPFGNMKSPGAFAPANVLGTSDTPVGLPTPGRTPVSKTPVPFWVAMKNSGSQSPSGSMMDALTKSPMISWGGDLGLSPSKMGISPGPSMLLRSPAPPGVGKFSDLSPGVCEDVLEETLVPDAEAYHSTSDDELDDTVEVEMMAGEDVAVERSPATTIPAVSPLPPRDPTPIHEGGGTPPKMVEDSPSGSTHSATQTELQHGGVRRSPRIAKRWLWGAGEPGASPGASPGPLRSASLTDMGDDEPMSVSPMGHEARKRTAAASAVTGADLAGYY